MHIQDFDPYDFEKKEINGVPVYWKNLPWAPCTHIRIVFAAGAFSDPVGKEGVAHFLEHMVFDGCPSMQDKKAVEEFGKRYTMHSLNAYTGYHRTTYTAKCLPQYFEKVLTGMKDMIFNSYLRPEDVEHERKVITQESWRRYKNEKYLAYVREWSKNIYHGHAKEHISSPLGWPETVAVISQSDVLNFHKINYTKENISIIVTGNIEEKDLNIFERYLSDIPPGTVNVLSSGSVGKPIKSRLEKAGEDIGDPTEQLSFSIERAGNKMSEKEKEISHHASQLLQDLLHERLRVEQSLCYSVSVRWNHFKDYQNVSIDVQTGEDKKDIVEKEIWNIIKDISGGKHQERFNTIHTLRLEWFESQERLSENIAEYAVNELIYGGKIPTLSEFMSEERKITYTEVADLVKKTFDPEYVFTEVILPTKK